MASDLKMEKSKNSKYINRNGNQEHDMFNRPIISIVKMFRATKSATNHRLLLDFINENPLEKNFALHFLLQLTDGTTLHLLDREADLFVKDVMRVLWFGRGRKVEAAFTNFVHCLVTAHNFHSISVLEDLFKMLVPEVLEEDEEQLFPTPGLLSDEELLIQTKIVDLITKVAYLVPMSHPYIFKFARKYTPFFKDHVHKHATYMLSLFMLSHAMISNGQADGQFRRYLLEVIISNLVTLDLHSPRHELDDDEHSGDEMDQADQIFEMEMDEMPKEAQIKTPAMMSHRVGHTLDVLMSIILTYVHNIVHGQTSVESVANGTLQKVGLQSSCGALKNKLLTSPERRTGASCSIGSVKYSDKSEGQTLGCECDREGHDDKAMDSLYKDLIYVFDLLIIPTHLPSHVQFIIFYFLSIRPGKVADFLDHLWRKFISLEYSATVRRNCIDFFGSLLARGSFISFGHLHSSLKLLSCWCDEYVEIKVKEGGDGSHIYFNSACQVLFYTFTFRYKEYTLSKSRLKHATSLQLDKLINSPLNPLKSCNEAILTNFSAITNHFQIAYCGNVIERNSRLIMPEYRKLGKEFTPQNDYRLEIYFPFDPYLLKRSLVYIKKHYREFGGLPSEIEMNLRRHKNRTEILEEDNGDGDCSFLDLSVSADCPLGISPGFKRFLT